MKKIVTDERVRQEENQVFAWVGRTMNFLLPLSFLIKSLVLNGRLIPMFLNCLPWW